MLSQFIWLLSWPISIIFYSADEMGIHQSRIPLKWSGPIILSVIAFYIAMYYNYSAHV